MDFLFRAQRSSDPNHIGRAGILFRRLLCGVPAEWICAVGGGTVVRNNGNALAIGSAKRGRSLSLLAVATVKEIKKTNLMDVLYFGNIVELKTSRLQVFLEN